VGGFTHQIPQYHLRSQIRSFRLHSFQVDEVLFPSAFQPVQENLFPPRAVLQVLRKPGLGPIAPGGLPLDLDGMVGYGLGHSNSLDRMRLLESLRSRYASRVSCAASTFRLLLATPANSVIERTSSMIP
jgi:hypothetical protein